MSDKRKGLRIILILIAIFVLFGCSKEPIKIGFIGSLTSKNSQLSIDARNAIILGVERINADGGINGRKVELIIKDDGADPEIALQKHLEFKEEHVKLVIGHMTSNMSEVILQSQGEDLLFLSPSMGTSSLSERDDFFLRTSPLTDSQAVTFFELINDLNIKNSVILYDLMNAEYTENLANYAKELNDTKHKMNLTLVSFDSRIDNVLDISKRLLENDDTEMVLLISQSIDTAVIAQVLKNIDSELKLCSVSWSMTEDLIINGGKAVEGMYFIGINKAEILTEASKSFQKAFYEHYQYEASFVSLLGYDALMVMVEGLKASDDDSPKSVKASILRINYFEGAVESFVIDEYGDNNKTYSIYQLINNQFIPQNN